MFYLKYRPKTISEIDNSQARPILKKILESANLPHAFLFVGQKGTGKTSAARIFAKAINCLNNRFSTHLSLKTNESLSSSFEPCNRCANCLSIATSSFTDVIEMDAASNRGIEEVKNLIRETAFLPMSGRFRVFIIDEAHMITNEGFNTLLKTLEEPPKTAVFILATTNQEKLPKTIISRCLKVNFGKARIEDIVLMLKRIAKSEELSPSDSVIKLIARHSDFSFRDAAKIIEEISLQKLSSLDQIETYLGIRGKDNIIDIIEKKDGKKTFLWIEEFRQNGGNFKSLLEDLMDSLRLQLLIKKGVKLEPERTSELSLKDIVKLIKLLMEAYQMMRVTPIDSLPLEIALTEFYNKS